MLATTTRPAAGPEIDQAAMQADVKQILYWVMGVLGVLGVAADTAAVWRQRGESSAGGPDMSVTTSTELWQTNCTWTRAGD